MSEISAEELKRTRTARDLKRAAIFLILINMYILIIDYIPLTLFGDTNILQFLGFTIGDNKTVEFKPDDIDAPVTKVEQQPIEVAEQPLLAEGEGQPDENQRGGYDITKANTLKNTLHFILALAALICLGIAAQIENPGLEYDYLLTPLFWALFISMGLNLIYEPDSGYDELYQRTGYRIFILIVFFSLGVALTVLVNNNFSAQDEEQNPPPSTPSA